MFLDFREISCFDSLRQFFLIKGIIKGIIISANQKIVWKSRKKELIISRINLDFLSIIYALIATCFVIFSIPVNIFYEYW